MGCKGMGKRYSDHIILQSSGLSCGIYYVCSHDKGEDVRIKDRGWGWLVCEVRLSRTNVTNST